MNHSPSRKLVLKILISTAFTVAAVFAWGDGPPPRFTGVYEEPNCRFCHDRYPLNAGRERGGTFEILGVPEQYTPGEIYTITVQIGQPGQKSWGFELATRFMQERRPAGTLTVTDPDTTQVKAYDNLNYMMHTRAGTYADTPDGPVEWSFDWTAPESGPALFAAAGLAANGPFDAYVYTTQQISTPAKDRSER